MDLVPLRVYSNHLQAQLARALLESEGIGSHVDDMDLLQTALGRVTLYVHSRDLERAQELLSENHRSADSPDDVAG